MYEGPADLYASVRPSLTAIESVALRKLEQIAREGRQATQNEVAEALGASPLTGTVPGVFNRLQAKGYITRRYYQRGLEITIVESGLTTAPPADRSPHWRNRTEPVPAPAIQSVKQRDMTLSFRMEQEARALGKPFAEFLTDLVYIGFHGFMQEREQA